MAPNFTVDSTALGSSLDTSELVKSGKAPHDFKINEGSSLVSLSMYYVTIPILTEYLLLATNYVMCLSVLFFLHAHQKNTLLMTYHGSVNIELWLS